MTDNNQNNNEIKIKKKRGRKPKPKSSEELNKPKVLKKRGRKPKANTEIKLSKSLKKTKIENSKHSYSINQVKFELDKENQPILLHLPIKLDDIINELSLENPVKYNPDLSNPAPFIPEDINQYELLVPKEDIEKEDLLTNTNYVFENENIKSQEQSDDEKQNINTVQEIKIKELENTKLNYFYDEPKLSKLVKPLKDFEDSNIKNEWLTSTSICCHYCAHPFKNTPVAIPKKYFNGKFYVKGCFCSFNCAAAYIFYFPNENKWEEYTLLNLLYKKVCKNPSPKKIKLAPDRITLNIFGGHLNIDDFRKSSLQNTDYKIIDLPMISLIPIIEENFEYVKQKDDNMMNFQSSCSLVSNMNLNIKRKKNDSIHTLENFMNLKIN
jgi:hypothetical protein